MLKDAQKVTMGKWDIETEILLNKDNLTHIIGEKNSDEDQAVIKKSRV